MISFERVRDLELIGPLFCMFRIKKGFILSSLTVRVISSHVLYIHSFSKGLHCLCFFLLWLKNNFRMLNGWKCLIFKMCGDLSQISLRKIIIMTFYLVLQVSYFRWIRQPNGTANSTFGVTPIKKECKQFNVSTVFSKKWI